LVSIIPDTSWNANSGLQLKDVIIAVDGKETKYRDELIPMLESNKGSTITATVLREGNRTNLDLKINDQGKIGVVSGGTYNAFEELGYIDIVQKKYGFTESISVGAKKFSGQMVGYWQQLKKIFTPSTGAYKGVGGFKAIFDIFPDTWSWMDFWSITAFLSIMLGVLNLLPIPALDGGHVMFLLYEMATGRKPGDKFMEYAQMIGFFLLIALVLLANGNDIYRAIFK
jgi:regulator of sigma E protease